MSRPDNSLPVSSTTAPDRPLPRRLGVTNAATTAGRSVVAIDTAAIARLGLGYRAVVVQASDGFAPYDFTLFETSTEARQRPDRGTGAR